MQKLIFEDQIYEIHQLVEHSFSKNIPEPLQKAIDIITLWQKKSHKFHIQTSGSTGTPKKIELFRDKIECSAATTASTFGLKNTDTLLCCLSLESIAGFMMLMRALYVSADFLLTLPSADPLENFSEDIKIDFASFVPLQMDKMLSMGYNRIKILNRMKAILLGGAAINELMAKKLNIIQAPIFQTYGMTETYTHIAIRRINGAFPDKAYHTLAGVEIKKDDRGCLMIKSEITDNAWLVTNDLVSIHEDGSFEVLGRYDNIINSGGIKIQLEKIEEITVHFPLFEERQIHFFASWQNDESLGQKLILVVEDEQWNEKSIESLKHFLSQKLSKYEIPKQYYFIKQFVKTESGKIDKIKTLNVLNIKQ